MQHRVVHLDVEAPKENTVFLVHSTRWRDGHVSGLPQGRHRTTACRHAGERSKPWMGSGERERPRTPGRRAWDTSAGFSLHTVPSTSMHSASEPSTTAVFMRSCHCCGWKTSSRKGVREISKLLSSRVQRWLARPRPVLPLPRRGHAASWRPRGEPRTAPPAVDLTVPLAVTFLQLHCAIVPAACC